MFQKTDITFDRTDANARERWQTVRAVVSGDQAMRAGKYLPYLNKQDKSIENEDRNSAYVQRAVFYNATGRTLDGLIGLAFKRAPSGDMPPVLDYLLRNADGRGNSIYQQSQATLAAVLMTGRHGLYIDYDNAQRPCIKSYAADAIINWRYQDGKLSMVVLKEIAEVTDGYGVSEINQWRELALENGQCVCRVWRMGDKGEPVQQAMTDSNGREVDQVVVRSRGHVLGYIPFQFIGSRNNDDDIDSAPLYDLARLNVAHFRNSADYEDIVFLVGQAQPWISGLTEEWRDHLETGKSVYSGSRVAMLLPQGGAFGYAQVSPNTLAKEAMDQKEAQMIALGARLIDQTAIAVTATQNENDREASTSVLSMCVSNVNEAYQNALMWCADMLDHPITLDEASGAFKISQDYARMKIDATAVSALVSAWQSGAIGLPDLRAYLRSEGVIAPERDDDMIDGDLEAQGPQLGDTGDTQDATIATGETDTGNSAKSAMQAQDASPPIAQPVPFDVTPIIAAIAAMGDKMQPTAPVDFAPLIAALNAREQVTLEATIDTAPIAQAMKEERAAHGTVELTSTPDPQLEMLSQRMTELLTAVATLQTKEDAPDAPEPTEPPEKVDLSPVLDRIATLAAQVTALQNEPEEDTAKIVADAIKPLQEQLAALATRPEPHHAPQPMFMIDPTSGNVTKQIQITRDAAGNITGASVAPQQGS